MTDGFFRAVLADVGLWSLDDWKDVAEVVKNFAETALAIVAAIALLQWNALRAKTRRGLTPAAPPQTVSPTEADNNKTH